MRRPRPNQGGRAERAKTRVKDRGYAGIAELDRHLIDAPACAENHHENGGGGIQMVAALGHGASDKDRTVISQSSFPRKRKSRDTCTLLALGPCFRRDDEHGTN